MYIGETLQYLSKRIYQHKYDVQKQSDETALASHVMETGHLFDFNRPKILASENNTRKRKIREAIEIIKHDNSINFKRDSENLSRAYASVINRIK